MDYKFKINDFEGPLDLLLHLIKESKMDIFNIEIVSLTNQYLDFISHMEELNLSIASSYLVMASELMYMKSNYLLPRPEKADEDEIDAKEELINRLKLRGEKNIEKRMERFEFESAHRPNFNLIIQNDNLDKTLQIIENILNKNEQKSEF